MSIEAFVRAEDSLSGISGVPGIQKVRRALRNQRPVSATAYLKTPTAFGFTGVFRRLARGIGILTDDRSLDDGGYELVSAWAKGDTRAGYYERKLQTKAGEVRLKVPKLRAQTFETAIIERYRRRESSVEADSVGVVRQSRQFPTAVVSADQVETSSQGFVSPRRFDLEDGSGISDHWPVVIHLVRR